MDITDLFNISPYSLDSKEKERIHINLLKKITNHHLKMCEPYKKIINKLWGSNRIIHSSTDVPFVPTRIFKHLRLLSVPPEEITRTMSSSGTSGQMVSKIYLDSKNAIMQTKVLNQLVKYNIASKRIPMLVIDNESTITDKSKFSARTAGILGFSLFAKYRKFALDDDYKLIEEVVIDFLNKNKGEEILIFGFTFMVWQHLYEYCVNNNLDFDLSNAILVHGGGWKKLHDLKISRSDFGLQLKSKFGLNKVVDYYGMVEQTGTLSFECEMGVLHTSNFSDIIIRNPNNLSLLSIDEPGVIQSISLLPSSYPGHSLLTDDEGVLLGIDNCKCGRKGKYFEVLGRIKNAETRGCSDTR